jgi:hypothetical protein
MHLSLITPSLFAGLGLADATDSLGIGPSPHGREVLFLVDGLGADVLTTYREMVPTLASLRSAGPVTTSFPSTTATSLATLTTGAMPGAHGMLGYTVRIPRTGGRILNALKWDERVDPVFWQPVPTLFERGAAAGINVTHVAAKRYEDSGFTRAVFRGAQYKGANITTDLIAETKRALEKTPSFVYLYVADLDSAGHAEGVGSEKWLTALRHIDAMVAQLLRELPQGTRLWITADHGMINAEERVVLGVENALMNNIETLAGETRIRHLYLADNSGAAVADAIALWQSTLGDKVTMHSRESAIRAGLFGPQVSLDASERAGDIIAIAQGGVVLIDPEREKLEGAMVGHHGGDSVIESSVPLLVKE